MIIRNLNFKKVKKVIKAREVILKTATDAAKTSLIAKNFFALNN